MELFLLLPVTTAALILYFIFKPPAVREDVSESAKPQNLPVPLPVPVPLPAPVPVLDHENMTAVATVHAAPVLIQNTAGE